MAARPRHRLPITAPSVGAASGRPPAAPAADNRTAPTLYLRREERGKPPLFCIIIGAISKHSAYSPALFVNLTKLEKNTAREYSNIPGSKVVSKGYLLNKTGNCGKNRPDPLGILPNRSIYEKSFKIELKIEKSCGTIG